MSSTKRIQQAAMAVAALAAGAAWAHPGHGSTGDGASLIHLLTEPDHVLAILSVVGIGIAAWASSRGEGGKDARQPGKPRRD